MILDCHLHLWDPAALDYPWLAGELDARFDLDRLGEHPQIGAALMMEADCVHEQARDEVTWVKQVAAQADSGSVPVVGMIAFAPLESEDLPDWLDAYTADPFIAGVRRMFHDDAPGFMLCDQVVDGARRLAAAGLPFDATVRQHQLAELVAFARALPELTIVLDHFGKPEVADPDSFDDWRTQVVALADCDNVIAKLSGIGAEADRSRPLAAQARPYLESALELFGPQRCLIGSDWPVSTSSAEPGWGYDDWTELIDEALAAASSDERWAVHEVTARRVYRVSTGGGNDG